MKKEINIEDYLYTTRYATRQELCDRTGLSDREVREKISNLKTNDLYGKGKIETSTCDKLLCEKCTNKLNNRDYCKEHIKELKEELKYIKLGDD